MNELPNIDLSLIPAEPMGGGIEPHREKDLAAWLGAVEMAIRAVEENRKRKTVPMNDALRVVNAEAKELAKPFEDTKARLTAILGAYRSAEEPKRLIQSRKRLEAKYREAEKNADTETLTALGAELAAYYDLLPKSVPAGDGLVLRYRTKRTLEVTDESAIPDRFFVRVLDEKAVMEAEEAGEYIPGVVIRETMTPYVVHVEDGADKE